MNTEVSFWTRCFYSTNHKDIGLLYLIFAIVAGVIGGALSVGMRMELQSPGMQIFGNAHMYNVFYYCTWSYHDFLHGNAGNDRWICKLHRPFDDRCT